jgi:hypothetical protein
VIVDKPQLLNRKKTLEKRFADKGKGMQNKNQQPSIEDIISAQEMDPNTLEDLSEKDNLDENLISGENCDEASAIIKSAFSKLPQFYANVGIPMDGMVYFGLLFMLVCSIVAMTFGLYGITVKYDDGYLIELLLGIFIFLIASAVFAFVLKRNLSVCRAYYFKDKGKAFVFYISKARTVYYRNRTQIVCIENKTRHVHIDYDGKYGAEKYMNLRCGFNRLVGKKRVKRTAAGIKIQTLEFRKKGNTTLWVDSRNNPIKIIISGDCYYKFYPFAERVISIPKELLAACDAQGIPRPTENSSIEYV